jgi:DNA-binding MarR family transcriptional regulator
MIFIKRVLTTLNNEYTKKLLATAHDHKQALDHITPLGLQIMNALTPKNQAIIYFMAEDCRYYFSRELSNKLRDTDVKTISVLLTTLQKKGLVIKRKSGNGNYKWRIKDMVFLDWLQFRNPRLNKKKIYHDKQLST